jgi:hypothetical protein
MSGSCYIGRPSMHYDGMYACVFPCMTPNTLLRMTWDENATTLENHDRIARHLDGHGAHLISCVYRPRA